VSTKLFEEVDDALSVVMPGELTILDRVPRTLADTHAKSIVVTEALDRLAKGGFVRGIEKKRILTVNKNLADIGHRGSNDGAAQRQIFKDL